jgi:hypothetical protein
LRQSLLADGTSLSQQQLVNLANTGAPGKTTLYGSAGADTFDSRGYATYEQGDGGDDTFIYNAGYGALEINEDQYWTTAAGVLAFGAGITLAQLTVGTDGSNDLLISDGTPGDLIKIADMLGSQGLNNYGVGEVTFANGTTLTAQQLINLNTTGAPGKASLYGSTGADTFDGLGYATYEQSNGGTDTFIYNAGYGALEINEDEYWTSQSAVLTFGAGITPDMVTGDSSNNIYLMDGTPGDRIRIDAMLGSQGLNVFGVGAVTFADGTTWTAQQVINATLIGSPSNLVLYGSTGADTFDSRGIATYEQGNGGADTFIYNAGYGALDINESQFFGPLSAVLAFGTGIVPGQITVSDDAAGNFSLTDGIAGDRIKFDNLFGTGYYTSYGIANVTFADGTSWSQQQVIQMAMTVNSGVTAIYGTTGADTIDSAGHATCVQGNGGADTFIYSAGYGALEIDEIQPFQPANAVVAFGAGITPGQITATEDNASNVYLSDGTPGDQIKIDNLAAVDNWDDSNIGTITFAGGTIWTVRQVLNLLTIGTSGDDTLVGTSGGDLFDGHGGNDTEQGNGGADTFIYDPGYGHLEIIESNPLSTNAVLQFGVGIAPGQITVTEDTGGNVQSDSIYLTDGIAGDQVKLDDALQSASEFGWVTGVTTVIFADGTVWTNQQLINMALTGTSGNDILIGSAGADTFDGKGGNDYEQGALYKNEVGEADTFIYNAGCGLLAISELNVSSETSVLRLGGGIAPNQVTVSEDTANNIYLTDGTAGDRIMLDSMVLSDGSTIHGVSKVTFGDGTVWTTQQVATLADTGAPTNTILYGSSGADVFDSKGYAMYEQGNGGADTFVFNPGYGHLEITEPPVYGDAAQAVLQVGAGIDPSALTFSSDDAGDLIINVGGTVDQIKLDTLMTRIQSGWWLGSIQFVDGTTWGMPTIIQNALA